MWLPVAAYLSARRAMARDQGRRPRSPIPLWRLLAGEIALLARRVGHWRVAAVTLVVAGCVLAVEVVLSDATPGPALTAPWRWIVASVASLVALSGWAVVHAHRATRGTHDEPGGRT